MMAGVPQRVTRLLDAHGIEPRKVLGQNFVVDEQLIDQVIALAQLDENSAVVEVGPGLGSLTSALARQVDRLVAIEKDDSLIPVLRSQLGDSPRAKVEVIEADAVDLDWRDLLDASHEWVFVANLPYNVAVPIIMSVLASAPMVQRGLVMVQLEVAERLVATPDGRASKTIGVPSVAMAWYAHAEIVLGVPPEAFHPVPNVASALVRWRRHDAPSAKVSFDEMMELVTTAYRKRRKMLRSSLGHRVGTECFETAGIDPTARPENLSLAKWVRLTECVAGGKSA